MAGFLGFARLPFFSLTLRKPNRVPDRLMPFGEVRSIYRTYRNAAWAASVGLAVVAPLAAAGWCMWYREVGRSRIEVVTVTVGDDGLPHGVTYGVAQGNPRADEIKTALLEFVYNFRRVGVDASMTHDIHAPLASFLSDAAYAKLNAYTTANPYSKLIDAHMVRYVRDRQVWQVPGSDWEYEVQWTEYVKDRYGNGKTPPKRVNARFSIDPEASCDVRQRMVNPNCVVIKDLDWKNME